MKNGRLLLVRPTSYALRSFLVTFLLFHPVSSQRVFWKFLHSMKANKTYVDSGDSLELSMRLDKLWPLRAKNLLNARARQLNSCIGGGLRDTSAVSGLELTRLLYSAVRPGGSFLLDTAWWALVRCRGSTIACRLLGTGTLVIIILASCCGQLGPIGGHAGWVYCAWVVLTSRPGCDIDGLASIIEPRMKHHLSWLFWTVTSRLVFVHFLFLKFFRFYSKLLVLFLLNQVLFKFWKLVISFRKTADSIIVSNGELSIFSIWQLKEVFFMLYDVWKRLILGKAMKRAFTCL